MAVIKNIAIDGTTMDNANCMTPLERASASVPSGETDTFIRANSWVSPRTAQYVIYAFAQFATNATGARLLSIVYSTDNFATVTYMGTTRLQATPNGNSSIVVTGIGRIPKNAKVAARVRQTSGATLTTFADFILCEIG